MDISSNLHTVVKASVPDQPRTVLKSSRYFLLLDHCGVAPLGNLYGFGLYGDDTRYLSGWELKLNGSVPTLLFADCEQGYLGRYIYANKDGTEMPEQKLVLERQVVLGDVHVEKLKLTNLDIKTHKVTLEIGYAADFADMFEVRGSVRKQRGEYLAALFADDKMAVSLLYRGLDKVLRASTVRFTRAPVEMSSNRSLFVFDLHAGESVELEAAIFAAAHEADEGNGKALAGLSPSRRNLTFAHHKRLADAEYAHFRKQCAEIVTDNPEVNRLIERSFRDLYLLRQYTPKGQCVAAGVPWFAVAFGRDQEITCLETLPFMSDISRQVLEVLCAYQGEKDDPFTEEAPGRIMHELRLGEMARLREIPFVPYYGTVDATPLFLVLMARYVAWTGDLTFARQYWSHVERALAYIERELKGGYLVYGGKPDAALSNQGWKDSGDSVMYRDGELARAPIALCEVQGYLYQAWNELGALAAKLGFTERAKQLSSAAQALKRRFRKDFWMESRGYVAIALDGQGRQCDVISSNSGHLLGTGILSAKQAKAVAGRLMRPDMFSGWGIRTLSSLESSYNPISYHNGSIWPHDNALIVEGLSASGFRPQAAKVSEAIFAVAAKQPGARLPELFCGFPRQYADAPIWYPVSCSPQAWAAGSIFMMLSSCLGLSELPGSKGKAQLRPVLPSSIGKVTVRGLRLAGKSYDLTVDGETVSLKRDSTAR